MQKDSDGSTSSIEREGIIVTENLENAIFWFMDAYSHSRWLDEDVVSPDMVDLFLHLVSRAPELSKDFPHYSTLLIFTILDSLKQNADIRHLAPIVLLMRELSASDDEIADTLIQDDDLTDPYDSIPYVIPVFIDICTQAYGADLTRTINDLLTSSGKSFDTYDFYLLIKDWDKFRELPIEWSLSLIQDGPIREAPKDDYDLDTMMF